uniref:Calcineurin-like phosphoesterase domain-containing protein n=1 Tax=viral metagenome TaxID=1070528 RepID=A0A6C0H7B4_9ZZZZ
MYNYKKYNTKDMHISEKAASENLGEQIFNNIKDMIDPFYYDKLKEYLENNAETIQIHFNHYKSLEDSKTHHCTYKIKDKINNIIKLEDATLSEFIYYLLSIIYNNAKTEKAWYPFFNQRSINIYDQQLYLAFDPSSRLRRIQFNFFHDRMGINDIGKTNEPIYFNVNNFGKVKIGVISDTHGYIDESISLLKNSNINILIHAGDISYEESRSLDNNIFTFYHEIILDKIKGFPDLFNDITLTDRMYQLFIDVIYEKTQNINIWKSLISLNSLNIPVYFIGGNHDYILEQLGLSFGHENLKIFIKNKFINLNYLYTEMESPMIIDNIKIMGKSVKIWGSGITAWKGTNDLQLVQSANNAFQYNKNIFFTAKNPVETSFETLLLTLPEKHFLKTEEGGDNTFYNIIITHSPIHISDDLKYQTRSTDTNNVFRNLIKNIFIKAKGDMHISGHSHRNHTLEDLDIEPFIINHNNKDVIIANVPVVNVWNGFEGFPVVISQFIDNDIVLKQYTLDNNTDYILYNTDEPYSHIKIIKLLSSISYKNKSFKPSEYNFNTSAYNVKYSEKKISEFFNLITSNIINDTLIINGNELFNEQTLNKITDEFIKNFSGLNINLNDNNFWYNHRDKIIGVNWPSLTIRQTRFISDNIYDHGIFGNFYLFKNKTFCVKFLSKDNQNFYIIYFNNSESLYHSIKIYFYYWNDIITFEVFIIICSNDKFYNDPQYSWDISRSWNTEYISIDYANYLKIQATKYKSKWDTYSWYVMILVVYYKAIIRHDFRTLLLDCGNAYILEDSSNNSEWGIFDLTQSIYTFDKVLSYIKRQENNINENSTGFNKLGISLMIVRVLLKYNDNENTDFYKLLKEYGIYKYDNDNIITTKIISEKKVHVNFIKEFINIIDTNFSNNLLDDTNPFTCTKLLSELYEIENSESINDKIVSSFTSNPNHLLCKLLYKTFGFKTTLKLETHNKQIIKDKIHTKYGYIYTYKNTISNDNSSLIYQYCMPKIESETKLL